MTKKKPEQIPIEEAIGDRAKDPKAVEKFKAEYETAPIPSTPQIPPKPDKPTPSEMLTLEELNHETVERLQDQYPEEEMTEIPITTTTGKTAMVPQPAMPPQKILALKPESQPATKTCSPESPVQEIDKIDEYQDAEKHEKPQEITVPNGVIPIGSPVITPAEDKELTALKKYIMGSGFVPTGVAYHIVALCSQPMTTPCTTTWDFKDRAMIPEMVFALLKQPGYLEGIWPSLKVVMSSNIGNDSWCAGICTTIAFFDVIRTLPAVKELAKDGS